jgi:peptidoglycan hydrolase-like protein with peptidoglycan-binding domain
VLINKLAGGQPVDVAKQQQAAAVQAPALLKAGARGSEVEQLQRDLKKLGYFTLEATGYYGDATAEAVRRMQAQHGAVQDGVAGESTLALVQKLLSQGYTAPAESQVTYAPKVGGSSGDYLVPWFGSAENIFSIGSVATIYDIDSGLSFKAKRTYGYNHADCEPLTYNDAQIMKRIYGGQWSWTRHAIIVEVNGRRMAASMAGMPHAGNDAAPANSYVTWRSGDYGAGTNLDTVKGNGVDGHFDVHFLNSRTHGTNSVDPAHQAQVKRAASWAAAN